MEGGGFSLKTVDPIINTKNTAMFYCSKITMLAHACIYEPICWEPIWFTFCMITRPEFRNNAIIAFPFSSLHEYMFE